MTDKPDVAPAITVPAVVSITAAGRRTLKHGDTFALCDELGDIAPVEHDPAGVFHHDTRHLSRLWFTLYDHRPLLLSSTVQPNNVVLNVDVTNPDFYAGDRITLAKDTFHVARAKFLWNQCCYELFTLTSFADQPVRAEVALDFDADFVDLFEVRGHRRGRRGAIDASVRGPTEVLFRYAAVDGVPRATRIVFDPAPTRLSARRAELVLDLAPRVHRSLVVVVQCRHGDEAAPFEPYFSAVRRARHARRHACARLPRIESSNVAFDEVMTRALADLAMLTTDTPHGPYPYAGVPWFSTVFGRDGIITALETLWFDPGVARGVLRVLAAHQADREDPARDMEPGKILHELRGCELARLGEVPFGRYYGTVDATPLFVVLAGRYWERTRDRATIEAILPNVRAALGWMDRYGDRDGDHFVEYARKGPRGLRNQGWKDSEDAIFHADGRLAEGAIALAEVQGYAYLARVLAARLFADFDDHELSAALVNEAAALRARFEERFWSDELGMYALALDGDDRPCLVRSSNGGQVLFSGIADPERAARTARVLFGPELFTGWGIRTIGTRERRFNPTSYHNGSVWPHDNALIGLGLARYGLRRETLALMTALSDAASHLHLRRLPELFCGFPAPARQAADSLPRRLHAASMGRGGAARAPAGLPRSRDRRRRGDAAPARAAAARLPRPSLPARHPRRREPTRRPLAPAGLDRGGEPPRARRRRRDRGPALRGAHAFLTRRRPAGLEVAASPRTRPMVRLLLLCSPVIEAPVHESVPRPPRPPPAEPAVMTRVLDRAVSALEHAAVPYVLLGGLASSLLGRGRHSTDVDLLVKPEHAEGALETLAGVGFDTERTNPHWLYKGFMDGVLVDVLFKAKGDIYLDDEMLARAPTLPFRGRAVRVIPPEDLIVIKAIVHDEESPRHWHDALGVLAETAMDWDYLRRRARKGPTRVLSLLLYAQSIGLVVPTDALRRLLADVLPQEGDAR